MLQGGGEEVAGNWRRVGKCKSNGASSRDRTCRPRNFDGRGTSAEDGREFRGSRGKGGGRCRCSAREGGRKGNFRCSGRIVGGVGGVAGEDDCGEFGNDGWRWRARRHGGPEAVAAVTAAA